MTYIPPLNGGRINATISGNTAGIGALMSTGTMTLAGGNNITLSQNGNAVTISGANAAAGNNTFGMSGGNTSGVAGSVTGSQLRFAFAGGNNVTLSQSLNGSSGTITISAANQTIQTQNLHNVTLSGNTAGVMAHVSSGTLTLAGGNNITLSQNGNAVTISAANGGGLTNINLSAGTTSNNLSNLAFNDANGVSFGLNGSTLTASVAAAGGGGATGSYFDNMFQQNSVQGITFTSVSTGMFGRVIVQPLSPGNELFPYALTASTMLLGFSNSGSSNLSAAHSSSWYFGIYTRVNSTQLSLLNSVSTSYALAANAGNSASYLGARWLSFHSSQFSSQPTFVEGSRYFFAMLARTSGASYASQSLAGMHLGHSVQRSGFMASGATAHTSLNAWHPFMGVHSLTTHTALPASIANSEINKASVYANFIPQVILNAGLGAMS